MYSASLFFLLAAPVAVLATLDPASSNTEGYCPSTYNCDGKYHLRQPWIKHHYISQYELY